jgi:membrane-bound metal-dependent hydrolase YbcI (DUF457 family)
MDNLAHALVGAVVGRAVADPKVPRAALLGVVAANAPDLTELLIGLPGDRSDYLVLHRGVTHSLAAALVETVVLTLLVGLGTRLWLGRRGRTPPWGWLAACIGIAVLSHLYMDWQGSYGLRPFLPWNGTWYYADWVAIVDPFFWLLPLIALAWGTERHWIPLAAVMAVGGLMTFVVVRGAAAGIVAPWVLTVYGALSIAAAIGWVQYWFGPVARRRVAAFALLVLALYAGAQGVAAQGEKAAVQRAALTRFGREAQWAVLTRAGWPFTWEPIYASRDTVAGHDWRLPRHLDAPAVQRALGDTREGRAMAQFARFLLADVDSSGDGVTVYLRDARYARVGRDGWAVVSVRLDPRP